MKVKTLKRTVTSVERECVGDLRRTARNLDPQFHPMQRAREYTRAVTASKLDRIFAKPLVQGGNMEHRDAVTCSAVSRRSLLPFISGSADGVVCLWDLATRAKMAELNAHSRAVTALTFDVLGQRFYSSSDDGTVHMWSINQQRQAGSDQPTHGPHSTWRIQGAFKSLDHHWMEEQFATASQDAVQIWSPDRSTALQTHSNLWGSEDTVNVVRFNPAERNLLACCSSDRGIGLFDTRTGSALKKTVLSMRSNDLQWNPMEPLNFCVANEDFNSYTFDMRKLDQPTRIYKGHIAAVMSVSWNPTGKEFVTGSYDRTIRIFPQKSGTSREIYHTKRMQRVFTVQYSLDSKFIISGSDDTNIRVWKSNASEKVGQLTTREEAATHYRQALIRRYQHMPEVRNIVKSRKVPKVVKKQTAQTVLQKEKVDRKQANRVKYAKNGEHEFVPERKKVVVKEID